MKKNLLWMCAAILTSGFALTACSVDDNPNPNPVLPSDPEELFEKTTTVFDFEDETTPFVADSRITTGVAFNEAKGSNVATFKGAGNAQNGYSFAHYDFTEAVGNTAAIVTVKFDYYNANSRAIVTIGDALVRGNSGGSTKITYNGKGGIFRIGSDRNNFFVNGTTLGGVADWTGKWLNVEVKVYNFDRQVEWVVKEGDEILAQSGTTEGEGEEAVFTPGKVDFYFADANSATQIDVFGYINNGDNNYLDNLTITGAVDPSIKFPDYTIHYVDTLGNELKASRISSGRVGTVPMLLESDKDPIYLDAEGNVTASSNDKSIYRAADGTAVSSVEAATKYIYESDNADSIQISEEGTDVYVTFREAKKYSLVFNPYLDGKLELSMQVRMVDALFEGDGCKYLPTTVIGKDGKFYALSADMISYNGASINAASTDNSSPISGKEYIIKVINYSLDASIVYFAECENLKQEGEFGTPYSQGTFPRVSQGMQALPLKDATITTDVIPAGTYDVKYYGRNDGTIDANNDVLYILAADGTLTKVTVAPDAATWASAAMGWITFSGVTIPEGAALVIKNEGEQKVAYDCIKVVTPAESER